MSEGCQACGFYALGHWNYCPVCGRTPVPSLAWFIAMEAVYVFIAVVGIVGIKVNREDSLIMGWIFLLTGTGLLLFSAYRYRQAVITSDKNLEVKTQLQ